MEVNFSSATNVSPFTTTTFTVYQYLSYCLDSTGGAFTIAAYTIILISLVLPLCIFIIYLTHEQWRQQNSSSRMSDPDFFTLHMVIIELINIFGFILCCFGIIFSLKEMLALSIYLLPISFCGQLFFHILTCVERYLAVVHPITYMALKNAHGIRIRNTIIVIVWLCCLAGISLVNIEFRVIVFVIFFFFLPFAVIVVSYCSIFVLCVLIRPGPGKVVKKRQLQDQSKLRAFYTIASILGTLLVRFGGNMIITILFFSLELRKKEQCSLWLTNLIMCLPCSLVLPLLFLQRARKLPCFKGKKISGQASD